MGLNWSGTPLSHANFACTKRYKSLMIIDDLTHCLAEACGSRTHHSVREGANHRL